jgi:hypothetical protein
LISIVINWFDKLKVTAQGNSAQVIEGVESPQMIKIEKATLFKE